MEIPILVFTLVVGIFTGVILQRGRVCTNSAFRNLLFARNTELMMIVVLTVTVELIGYQILEIFSLPGFTFESNPIPLSIILLPIGGFLFGLGTVFAGGCAGGICYRIGEGSFKALLAFLGFATGIGILSIGPLSEITINFRASTSWLIDGRVPSLEMIFPRWIWTIVALVLALSGIMYYYKKETKQLTHLLPHWTPLVSGILLGFLGVASRYLSTLSGRAFGFSTTDGIGEIFQVIASFLGFFSPIQIGWAGLFILGLIFGAAVSSIQIHEFKLKFPNQLDIIQFFGGGLLMGFGAMLALGCNFGHVFGGIPELGLSSFLALIFMITGNWVGSYIYYSVMAKELPESTPINLSVE
ncbi:MAG: YeeE/YedE family protein [Candidatus Heimdallarchaeota archaeon]|nr:MAG: YeeE/YedE family protein [Candidatus Heimdallarchaeota archaeon]